MKFKVIMLIVVTVITMSCENQKRIDSSILEVTTFSLKTTANKNIFNVLDSKVEENFTSKQPGFIRRQSGVSENGIYTVIVDRKSVV